MRRILHIDMDAFFASVEQVRDPSLLGKPLIIGGSKEDLRGVVSTASYEARKFGVHSAMPLAQAKKLCPHGIFMRGNHQQYGEESRKIRAILERVSPIVQMASIDEAYIDVSGSYELLGGDAGIAQFIKENIKSETSLPCSIAISANKLVSKVASEFAKPNGFISVPNGTEEAFFAPLPVRKLPGAGPRCCSVLASLGIETLGQLAGTPINILERKFGLYTGLNLQRRARGISDSPVEARGEVKSISRETTFPEDTNDWKMLEQVLAKLLERCMFSLREDGLYAKCVTLKIRYHDFETKSFSCSVKDYSRIDHVFMEALQSLLPKAKTRRDKVRLIGVGLSQFRAGHVQGDLFETGRDDKWEKALETVDALKAKHGHHALRTAKSLNKNGGG